MDELFGHILSGGMGAGIGLALVWQRMQRMQKDIDGLQADVKTFNALGTSIAKIESNQEHFENFMKDKFTSIENQLERLSNKFETK